MDNVLFQRLRRIRQNDVASFVYPSLNITRFEHALGCAHVAGRMAQTLVTRKDSWPLYEAEAGLNALTFQRVCRLYALLHDVGHLPFSHVFEHALEDYALAIWPDEKSPESRLCDEWFGQPGFDKAHEAFGANIAKLILDDVAPDKHPLRDDDEQRTWSDVKKHVLTLLTNKKLNSDHVLYPAKQLIDSEVDADRIDSTARDGRLAGGEYGSYDIERICSAPFLYKDGSGWRLAFSRNALSSIEGLLLDRYRIHTWIHFHHRVVATKAVLRILLRRLLEDAEDLRHIRQSLCPKETVATSMRAAAELDDVWLCWILRQKRSSWEQDTVLRAALDAFLDRTNDRVHPLWRDRAHWHDAIQNLLRFANLRDLSSSPVKKMGRDYEGAISQKLGSTIRVLFLKFKPVERRRLIIVDDRGESPKELLTTSALVEALPHLWANESQFHVIVVGKKENELSGLLEHWTRLTGALLRETAD